MSATGSTRALLVELLVEELPPKLLQLLGEAFATGIEDELRAQALLPADVRSARFATPRRLAVTLGPVFERAADGGVRHKLMPAGVGLGAGGEPTPALRKKFASLGIDASLLSSLERDGETLFVFQNVAGIGLAAGLQRALDRTLGRLPIAKVMQYQLADGWTSVSFVRPAHGLVALHGDDVVPVKALGLDAGRTTLGHRFEARQAPIALRSASTYEAQLRDEGAVIAGFAARRAEIEKQLQARAGALSLTPMQDDALLDEVAALVERPNVLACEFEREFLGVPPECLILTMKANQRYFPLHDAAGALTNRFLVVSNITPADPSRVIEGNERVVRPRLADAKFFFDQDRRKTLASRVAGLDKVVYHAKLGTQGERTQRVRAIAARIADAAFAKQGLAEPADRAAELAKADLLTDMVGEFPELQGVMGGYYARHDGERAEVAQAIEDHYKPRFAGDALPRGPVGVIVALADKLEVLVGLFGIGQLPSGDKDPFALRRQALGVIRMLIEVPVPIGLEALVGLAVPAFGTLIRDPAEPLLAFVRERLAGSLREQGYGAQEVDAVLSRAAEPMASMPLADVKPRLDAVRAFAALPEALSLAAANKRVGNILKKSEAAPPAAVDATLLVEPAEQALARALDDVGGRADAAYRDGRYAESLRLLAGLKAPVDAFFDGVMVNAEAAALRANRLALLASLRTTMNRVADLSRLAA